MVRPRRLGPTASALALVACAAVPGREARAEGGGATAALEWAVPEEGEGCIAGGALREAVEALLRRQVFTDDRDADLVVRGSIRRTDDDRWRVSLRLSASGRPVGSRTLVSESADCRGLDQALPLVLALMLDVDQADVVLHVPPAAEEVEPAAPPPPRAAEGEADPGAARRVGWGVGAGGAAAFAMLPGELFGIWNTWSLVLPRPLPSLDLRGLFLFPAEHLEGGEGTESRAWLVGVAVCPALLVSRWVSVDACAGTEAGTFTSRGIGFDVNHEVSGPLWDLFAEARLSVRVAPPLEVRLALGAAVPLLKQRFTVVGSDGEEEMFQADMMFARVDLGLVLRWPR